jgi:hypothetical protein
MMQVGEEGEDESEDSHLREDILKASRICALLARDARIRKDGGKGVFQEGTFLHGADVMFDVDGKNEFSFPAHRVILAARSTVLEQVLGGGKGVKEGKIGLSLKNGIGASKQQKQHWQTPGLFHSSSTAQHVVVSGCHPLTVLIFVDYLYTDVVLALWDRRVGLPIEKHVSALRTSVALVRSELQVLARLCDLPHLRSALDAHVKRPVMPSLSVDMHALFQSTQVRQLQGTIVADPTSPLAPDTILELADSKTVFCHSAVLRARSPFFAGFFGDKEWTVGRWRPDWTVVVDLRHMRWREMAFVMRYVYGDAGVEMFDVLGKFSFGRGSHWVM